MYTMSPMSGKLLNDEEAMVKYVKENQWGLATAIDLRNCDPAKIRSKEIIAQFAIDLCEYIDMKRFGDPIVVRFGADPQGAGIFPGPADRDLHDLRPFRRGHGPCLHRRVQLQGVPSEEGRRVLREVLRRQGYGILRLLQELKRPPEIQDPKDLTPQLRPPPQSGNNFFPLFFTSILTLWNDGFSMQEVLFHARTMERFKIECRIRQFTWAHSLAWLERPADNREVKSPNLLGPIHFIFSRQSASQRDVFLRPIILRA